jgi:peptidyl-prolyl cis-trans isomerase C
VNALLARVGESVTVSDAEVEAAFEANPRAIDPGEKLKLRYILLRLPPSAPEQVKEALRVKAATAVTRARAGEDFDALVQEFADDASRAQGGKLEIRRGMMPRPFEQAAYALRPGQVSELVPSPDGVSVIKLDERVPGPPVSFEEVKEAVRFDLLGKKRREAYQALVESLRAKARIETYL